MLNFDGMESPDSLHAVKWQLEDFVESRFWVEWDFRKLKQVRTHLSGTAGRHTHTHTEKTPNLSSSFYAVVYSFHHMFCAWWSSGNCFIAFLLKMRATWNFLAVNFLAQAEERKNCAKNDSKRTKSERRRGRRGRWWWWWGGKVQWNTIVYSSETNINKHLTTCPKAIKYMISSWAAQRVMHFDLKLKSHTEATRQQSRYAMVTFNFVLSLTWANEKKQQQQQSAWHLKHPIITQWTTLIRFEPIIIFNKQISACLLN